MKERSRPIAIDLFAGAGGMSLGFEQAGFDIVAAVEIDPVHACAHKFNFPDCTVIPQSVSKLTARDIRAIAGIGNQKVNVVFGGAPCQGFSMIGQRIFDDARNLLVKEFVRLVNELDSDYFVFENVKGLTVGKHRRFLNELIGEFESLGYQVRKTWQVLNAANYGVPQNRQRLFLLGSKQKKKLPYYPKPITCHIEKSIDCILPPTPTCLEALGDLPDAEDFPELWLSDQVCAKLLPASSSYASEMRCISPTHWHFSHLREWDQNLLTSSSRTDHTAISRRRFAETEPGTVEPISRFYKLPHNGISNTLRAGTDGARGAFTSPRPIHYKHDRCVTVREMARLHGFPDWFRLHQTKWHGARQVGNAVPPPLARAVALSVAKAMDYCPVPSYQLTQLGDPALLRMDLTQASSYWGIAIPPSKRDRKSGAKKRSQLETEKARLVQVIR